MPDRPTAARNYATWHEPGGGRPPYWEWINHAFNRESAGGGGPYDPRTAFVTHAGSLPSSYPDTRYGVIITKRNVFSPPSKYDPASQAAWDADTIRLQYPPPEFTGY